jgi:hypothetical protein
MSGKSSTDRGMENGRMCPLVASASKRSFLLLAIVAAWIRAGMLPKAAVEEMVPQQSAV